MNKNISIILSLYNEEKSVYQLSRSLDTEFSKLKNINIEVIWVNDGSTDGTSQMIDEVISGFESLNATHSKIDLSKNFGHEAAMICGIDHATGDALICMDADGQHPPSEISRMLTAFFKGNDYVLMSQIQRKDKGMLKKRLSSLFYRILNFLSSIPLEKNASDFFLISADIATILRKNYREKNRFIRGFIQSMGFTNCTLYFTAPKRMHGESHYSNKKLIKLAWSAIFTFSLKPLRLSILLSLFFILITLLLSIYSIYKYIDQETIPSGYTTIILFVSFSFTLLFSILSIAFLYFEKLIEEIRQTPLYIIKKRQEYAK